MTDDVTQPDDTVSMEYFTDTVNDYLRQGDSKREAPALAADDGLELIEDRTTDAETE